MSDQPEALRLANKLAIMIYPDDRVLRPAAAELRRQHAHIEALEADRDSWIDQCSQRVADWSEAQARIEADEALMRYIVHLREQLGWCKEVDDAIDALRARLESSK